MGRPTRIQYPGACYHVVLQGNNNRDIFMTTQDRRAFLALMKSYKDRYALKVYAYCLMNSYVHLLVETGQANLSKVMQGFNTAYTKYFNSQHGSVGHVFQGRYKALLVDKGSYLLEVTRYIHLAPVREGLKEKAWRYQWSSCPAYVEAETREVLVDSGPVLKGLTGGSRLKQSVRYLQYIKERAKDASEELPTVEGFCVGTPEFAAEAQRLAGLTAAGDGPAPITGDVILAEVIAKHGVDQETLVGRNQWRDVSAVRKEAIYRMWKEARMGVTEIGRVFNRTPSAVSQLIRAMETSRVSRN
ncbi:MAG: transposase [Elusimicrobia bacterium]|nr:transposase [Elusimicrobiota bacterium]